MISSQSPLSHSDSYQGLPPRAPSPPQRTCNSESNLLIHLPQEWFEKFREPDSLLDDAISKPKQDVTPAWKALLLVTGWISKLKFLRNKQVPFQSEAASATLGSGQAGQPKSQKRKRGHEAQELPVKRPCAIISPETKQKALEMAQEGKKRGEIAKALNLKSKTVGEWLSKAGLTDPKHKPSTKAHDEEIKNQALNLAKAGLQKTAISRDLNLPLTTVANWLRQAKLTQQPLTPSRQYSQETKNQVLELAKAGGKGEAIARELGIPNTTVLHWLRKEQLTQPPKQYAPEIKAKALEMTQQEGMNPYKIARLLNAKYSTVRAWVKKVEEAR